jgi:hypothetical protein
MRTITVKLPRPLAERLGRPGPAAQHQVGRREEAIEAHLATEASVAEGSCYDLSSDLAGVVSGPSDLSSNRRRLKGYGR